MQVARQEDRIRLTLNTLETQIFAQVLRSVIKDYKLKPGALDPKAAAAWYSTRSCEKTGMTPEEISDWLDSLHAFKSAQVSRLEEWAGKLAIRESAQATLDLTFNEGTALITILNDYRLLVASRHDIGQREMDLHSLKSLKELTTAQQNAVCEIHFLAWVIEELIKFTAPEASRWMDTASSGN